MIKVLIVDDDKLARKGIISIMPWDKYDMKIIGDVQNGRAALEFLKDQEADIMFVDIDMPELGGIELMEECRKNFPNVQFVVLTFYEEFSYAQAAIRYGVLDYISKVQMEKEDGESILKRVFSNYKQRNNTSSKYTDTHMTQDEWDVLKKEWQNFYWLYDTAQFEILINKTKQLKPDNRKLERLFLKCIQSTDNSFGREETAMPFLTEIDLILDWLKEWRYALYEWALQRSKNVGMQICIMRAINYLKIHLTENLKAEEVADEIGMSRSYFSINFKKFTGKTFHEYVKGERMAVAAGLLTKTDKKVIDIAKESGFDDINYFNRVFHEVMKSSPTDFRKNLI
ncbi:response regulator [Anaerocolumna sp. MB42-C2]|uniref:response regulator n=1 Tax=Anaerocolumna sp. MB42-C2 TaxID=3070997 RepID=UPI0027E1FA43|nr:response regulator [Anaerocolumna sp. MB42-C2]WMJ86217.1 response regulator [Anaerocolumna sp. MB42-C2]